MIAFRNLRPIENTGFGGSVFVESTRFFRKKHLTKGSKSEALHAQMTFAKGAISTLPIYSGGHAACQNIVVEQLRSHYDDPAGLPDVLLDIAHFGCRLAFCA